jgi:hypothetical protein
MAGWLSILVTAGLLPSPTEHLLAEQNAAKKSDPGEHATPTSRLNGRDSAGTRLHTAAITGQQYTQIGKVIHWGLFPLLWSLVPNTRVAPWSLVPEANSRV